MEVLRKRALAGGGGGLLHASLAKGVGTEGYPRIAKPPPRAHFCSMFFCVK